MVTRIETLPDGIQIYDIAKFFAPMFEPSMVLHRTDMMGLNDIEAPHSHRGDTIILGLRMTAYEEARRADIQHAFIMAGIILVLGSGALFFIVRMASWTMPFGSYASVAISSRRSGSPGWTRWFSAAPTIPC